MPDALRPERPLIYAEAWQYIERSRFTCDGGCRLLRLNEAFVMHRCTTAQLRALARELQHQPGSYCFVNSGDRVTFYWLGQFRMEG